MPFLLAYLCLKIFSYILPFGIFFLYLSIQKLMNMAHQKQCNKCGKVKDHTHFAKKTASTDGLQCRCKECNKIDNEKFRTEKPQYQLDWQKKYPQRTKEIIRRYRTADKGGRIYYIKNPEGQFYIGATGMYFNVRIMEHKTKWRRFTEGKVKNYIPLLYKSLDKWGWDNHEMGVLLDFEDIDRKELLRYETQCIESFKQLGISLNVKTK